MRSAALAVDKMTEKSQYRRMITNSDWSSKFSFTGRQIELDWIYSSSRHTEHNKLTHTADTVIVRFLHMCVEVQYVAIKMYFSLEVSHHTSDAMQS